jgi:hypothetical protein
MPTAIYNRFLLLPLFISCFSVTAQQSVTAKPERGFNDSLAASRIHTTRTAMLTLGSWATANIATGFIAANQTAGQASYFWRMNAYWNFFNLGIAALGYWNAARIPFRHYSYEDNLHEQHKLEKIYAINFGLDFVYIAGGIVLHAKSKSSNSVKSADQLAGYGTSIITQGAFLLVMDAIMLHIHKRNTRRLDARRLDLDSHRGGS